MKSVLIPIQPYWVFLIISKKMGWEIDQEKTVEVRKTFPKDLNWNRKSIIYCSKNKQSFNRIPKKYQPLMEKFLGQVIGEFVCDRIDNYECELWNDKAYELIRQFDYDEDGDIVYKHGAENNEDCEMLNKACLTWQDIRNYLGDGINDCYAWHITDLVIYDKPKELGEFKYHCKYEFDDDFKHCDRCEYYYFSNTPMNGREEWCGCDGIKTLKRPPQSWCYVKEIL